MTEIKPPIEPFYQRIIVTPGEEEKIHCLLTGKKMIPWWTGLFMTKEEKKRYYRGL